MPGSEGDDPGSKSEPDDGRPDVTPGGDVVLRLPASARDRFKDPMGPVSTDAEELLADAGRPLLAIGDVVTYHLRAAGTDPDVAVVDGYTERETASETIREAAGVEDVADADRVPNPAATLTAELLTALAEAVDDDEPRTLVVDGEEDLGTLPAVFLAPDGASVVYGQPGEGMVHVRVGPDERDRVRELLSVLDGDVERAFDLLDGR
jgi:uncharacterized protein (UPF0218 family)